jgi:hypothetical protein
LQRTALTRICQTRSQCEEAGKFSGNDAGTFADGMFGIGAINLFSEWGNRATIAAGVTSISTDDPCTTSAVITRGITSTE